VHEGGVQGIDGACVVLVDERGGKEGDGVEDCVFETGRHVVDYSLNCSSTCGLEDICVWGFVRES
jgi:hypothetical protein